MNDLYVLVDHNQKMIIDHIKKLPENWNNINGLNLLDSEKLYNLDWAGQLGLGWVKINDDILKNYTHLPEWFEISKSCLKALISNERWEKEQDIITFKQNKLKLDDRTRSSLSLQKSALNPETTEINWKFINGFVSLSVEDFTSLYLFSVNYIQECFNEEKRLINLYDSANFLEDLLLLNITPNWPSNNFL